jgi:Fungal protein kinase
MAGDLVTGSNIWHTFAHDLESFFWVLLWIVLTQVQTNYTDEDHSNFIHGTMNSTVCSARGGSQKASFLASPLMLLNELGHPGNRTLTTLVVNLKRTVADRYCSTEEPSDSTEFATIDPYTLKIKAQDAAADNSASKDGPMQVGFLEDHSVVIKIFATSLLLMWPSDDKAKACRIMQPLCTAGAYLSGSKRSRSAIEMPLPDDEPPRKW